MDCSLFAMLLMARFVISSTISSSLFRSSSPKFSTASVSCVSNDVVASPPCDCEPLTVANPVAATCRKFSLASALKMSTSPTTPDRNAPKKISALSKLRTFSPRMNLATPSPKNSLAASDKLSAKSSSSWLSFGAAISVNSLSVRMARLARCPSVDPGSRIGKGTSSILGGVGKMSPKKGRDGGLGGVNATKASVMPLRKICRVRMSTMESTSGSNSVRKLSAWSDSKNLRLSLKSMPSSGMASRSTNAAPSCVATCPAALFNSASSRESFNPWFDASSLPEYRTSCKAD
mmetsp:Transcript_6919/g.18788  ORF Transcript_6919/g.18788 Transcript_6919/m.18788 type:complete len:290 (-) Transcript_6919:3-872(-)